MSKNLVNNKLIFLILIIFAIYLLSLDTNTIRINNTHSNNSVYNATNNTLYNNISNEEQEHTISTSTQSSNLEEPNRFAKMFRANLDYLDINDIVNFMQYNSKLNKINLEKENSLNGGYLYSNIVGYSNSNCYSGL